MGRQEESDFFEVRHSGREGSLSPRQFDSGKPARYRKTDSGSFVVALVV
jgi:hypothetical protein